MPYRLSLLFLVALAGCGGRFAATATVSLTPSQAVTSAVPAAVGTMSETPLAATVGSAEVQRAEEQMTFTATGHSLRGDFLAYWKLHGGLSIFGMPLTEPLWIDGRMTQFFERARFEAGDGGVQLGLLGSEQARLDRPSQAQPDCQFFAETRHNVCAPFLQFWRQHGGIQAFGFPLAEADQQEPGSIQWFERARMEQPRPHTLLLGRLGDEALQRMPGGQVLRSATQASGIRAKISGPAGVVAPLDVLGLDVQVEQFQGPAELLVVDRRGSNWTTALDIVQGRAHSDQQMLGALGAHAAIVRIGGNVAGVSTRAFMGQASTTISTGQPRFDRILPLVKGFMEHDVSEYVWGENRVHGYRSPDSNLLWLRDHVHQGKGYAYWEADMRSLLDQFRRFQHPDGAFDDYMANFPWGEVRGRTEVEADNEYLFIEGAYRAWQSTGDEAWVRLQLPAMERGLQYIRTSPMRWDAEHQLVKRPFTVDTWDFEYGPMTIAPDGKRAPRHWIDNQTKWSIFFGDNTGYAHGMELLARMYDATGDQQRAAYWRGEARGLMERLMAVAWNGHYFRHMVHLVPVDVPGVDEASQLSLSNAYVLNRDVIAPEQRAEIIQEYQRRYQQRGSTFSEWYSIDPPFPAGSLSTGERWGKNPGEYVNGGMMPLVGGELARGALNNGYERYGLDILQRYYSLIDGTGASYLWYYPIGLPGLSGPDSLPTDGWGSSAMLAALVEGAAGVQDDDRLFARATIAPRWSATNDVQAARVTIRYGASDGYVAYRWNRDGAGLRLSWTGSGDQVRLKVLLPEGTPPQIRTVVDGQQQTVTTRTINGSRYVDVDAHGSGSVHLTW
ncbi:MAG: hypothetical protein NVSMB42_06060 [Herpetosiphon sp.]